MPTQEHKLPNNKLEQLLQALELKDYERASELIASKDYDVNFKGKNNKSALHFIVISDNKINLKITSLLIAAKYNVNSLDNNKQSALHIAASNGALLQARLLLQAGAKQTILDSNNKTPGMIAQDNNFLRLADLLNEEYIDDYASDTDSEDEADYKFKESVKIPPIDKLSTSKDNHVVIHHYRGVHFYKDHFSRQARKQERKLTTLTNQGVIPRQGIYSSANYEVTKVPYSIPAKLPFTRSILKTIEEREAKLETGNKKITKAMQKLQASGNVTPCLAKDNSNSREIYESRYIEFVQRYVNSYRTFLADLKDAATHPIDKRCSDRTKDKWTILKGLKFSSYPFVSTSEEPHWAFEYAFALVNWDKNTTHQPRSTEVEPLTPCYQADGHPRFPYLGVVYVSVHLPDELQGISTRIIDLFVQDLIDTKCASPGGHTSGGYIRARERIFIGGIDAEHISLSMVVRVPSFYGPYKKFYKDKYNLDEKTYNKYKLDFANYGTTINGKMRNELNFHSTQQKIIQQVMKHQQELLQALAHKIDSSKGLKPKFYGIISNQITDKLPEIADCVEERSKTLKQALRS